MKCLGSRPLGSGSGHPSSLCEVSVGIATLLSLEAFLSACKVGVALFVASIVPIVCRGPML